MDRSETAKLLAEVRAIDNRNITDELIDGWHKVLNDLPLPIALEAHRLARRDASINFLEPRHLVGWSREARANLQPKEEQQPEPQGAPQPRCREHKKLIMECAPCQRRMAGFADRFGLDRVLKFAQAEIYE